MNLPGGGGTIGTVVGATIFTGADQTSPIGRFASLDGNSATPNVDVASASNDMVLDTVAFAPVLTVNAFGGVQAQQWVDTSYPGFGGSGSDVAGLGSSSPGAPSGWGRSNPTIPPGQLSGRLVEARKRSYID